MGVHLDSSGLDMGFVCDSNSMGCVLDSSGISLGSLLDPSWIQMRLNLILVGFDLDSK